jgi:hypothetical protein
VNNPLDILKQTYGYDQFRGQQSEIIDYVVQGGSAFVLMPTGKWQITLLSDSLTLPRRGWGNYFSSYRPDAGSNHCT